MLNQKTHTSSLCIFTFLLSSTLIGCQKPDTPNANTHKEYKNAQTTISEPSIPTTTIQCEQIDATISKLKKTYSPESLIKLNDLFKECLATVPLKKRYEWLEASHLIYDIQISKLPASIQQYITQLSKEGNTLSDADLKQRYNKMNHQDKYTIDHLKELYFYQYNEGEGYYSVSLDPAYKLAIFAASLEKADHIYLKEDAIQNDAIGGSIDKDAGLSVSFTQLGDWIIFWEDYLKKYPQSYFKKSAQHTIVFYQKYLFLGLENTPVFEFDNIHFDINQDALKAITKLSKTQSPSAEKAKNFLTYVENIEKTDVYFNEETGTQAEYNAAIYQQEQNMNKLKNSYFNDLSKIINLK